MPGVRYEDMGRCAHLLKYAPLKAESLSNLAEYFMQHIL